MQPFYEVKSTDLNVSLRSRLEISKHLHHHVELAVMVEGATHAYAGERGGLLQAGQAFISFPNQVHQFLDDCGKFRCYLFIFSPNLVPAFNKTFSQRIPLDPIIPIDSETLLPLLQMLLTEAQSDDKFSPAMIEGGLDLLLTHIFRRAEWEDVDRRNINAIRAILDYCNENYTADITLEDVAANTHMSKYYISHVFSKEMGVGFPQYVNSLRIHDAKELLAKGGMSVTDIAYAVGFNSVRSFNRQFLAESGQTPREFQKSYQE